MCVCLSVSVEMGNVGGRPTAVQELKVYKINERDKGSPVILPLGGKKDAATGEHTSGLGDLVPFSNKVGLSFPPP